MPPLWRQPPRWPPPSGLLALLVPLFSGWAVGAVGTEAGRVDLGRVALWCAGAALAAALSALFAYGAAAVLTRAAQAVVLRAAEGRLPADQ